MGALQFVTEGHDYRDQPIAKGVYTIRYRYSRSMAIIWE